MKEQLTSEVIVDGVSNNLQISEDTGFNDEPIAVFLYTPYMGNTSEHFHPMMSIEQVEKLYVWLGKFLQKHSHI